MRDHCPIEEEKGRLLLELDLVNDLTAEKSKSVKI